MIANSNTISEGSNTAVLPSEGRPTAEDRLVSADIFDKIDDLRLTPDAASVAGTIEILSHVPVRKPNRYEFFRTPTDHDMWFGTGVFEDKQERETFFVTPRMREQLVGEIKPVFWSQRSLAKVSYCSGPSNCQWKGSDTMLGWKRHGTLPSLLKLSGSASPLIWDSGLPNLSS